MARRLTAWTVGWLALGTLAQACGGGAAPSTSKSVSAPSRSHDGEASASEAEADEEETPAAPALSRCDDGTCFACGQGICPKGFYCDEQAIGGAACAWLPGCPAEAACSCVKRTLGAACACDEREGGVFVSCK